MGIFISWEKTLECVLIALCFGALLTMSSTKLLGALQEFGYSGRKLLRWARKRNNMSFERLALLGMLCALSCAIVSLCFSFAGQWAALVGLVPYAVFFGVYIYADGKIALRVPAVRTRRFRRLEVVLFLVCAIASYIIITLLNFAAEVWGSPVFDALRYCPLAVMPLLLLPLICAANGIAKIYEVPHNRTYIRKATEKLAASGITVVGITGSYGKTSTKNILAAMLGKKFRVLSTPRSHNTPIGISLAVNANDLSEYDVFIAEMGARNVGDISELCAICPPDYSLITGICAQHLETFESLENIIKAKGEILSATRKKAFIASDCSQYFKDSPCLAEVCNCVSDIDADCGGTQFTLTLGGKSVRVHTRLLGAHCAYNIGIAACLAFEMGVDLADIAAAAEELEFVEHRLQLTTVNGINILDDGYNANVKGARAALDVLHSFGGRKLIVTPGIVELGILEESENREFGKLLAGLDCVILVGDTLVAPVKEGYAEAGGDPEKLLLRETLKDAQAELKKMLEPGDTVLFLNDLPDIY